MSHQHLSFGAAELYVDNGSYEEVGSDPIIVTTVLSK